MIDIICKLAILKNMLRLPLKFSYKKVRDSGGLSSNPFRAFFLLFSFPIRVRDDLLCWRWRGLNESLATFYYAYSHPPQWVPCYPSLGGVSHLTYSSPLCPQVAEGHPPACLPSALILDSIPGVGTLFLSINNAKMSQTPKNKDRSYEQVMDSTLLTSHWEQGVQFGCCLNKRLKSRALSCVYSP